MSAALDLLHGLPLEDGRRFAEAAQPWQRADAEAFLDLSGPRLHYWARPRGASKTTDAAMVGLVALVAQLPRRARGYLAAADAGQAGLLLDALAGFVIRAGLGSAVKLEAAKATAVRTGATLEVLAADEASSWGLRPALLIVDEFAAWKTTAAPRRFWRSLFSSLPKMGARLAVLTTAGEPSHPAYRLLERARASSRWRVSEVPGPCPWLNPDDLEEQRAELPEWEYRRLHLGKWVESEDRLTNVGDLAACVTLDGPRDWLPGRGYTLALDVGLKADRTVLAACSAPYQSQRVALDRMLVWQGSRDRPVSLDVVEAAIVEAWQAYRRPPLIADPWQSAQLCQRLRRRGVRVVEHSFTATSVSRLALCLHGAIRDRALELPDDPELLDELANVRLRETSPGVYRLDHDSSRHDDRAVSLALALQHLLAKPAATVGAVLVSADELGLRIPSVDRDRTLDRLAEAGVPVYTG